MKGRGFFSTTISCGALAGLAAGALWATLVIYSLNNPPRSVSAFFFENAFRTAACMGLVLCGSALYQRSLPPVMSALGWAVVAWVAAMLCAYVCWRLTLKIVSGRSWTMVWRVYQIIYMIFLCPLLGGMTGYFLSRLYGVASLSSRAIRFGVLGCTVHLVFGLFMSLASFLNWSQDTPEAMALHTMFAIMGYVFLGAISGIPFDRYFRAREAERLAGSDFSERQF